MKRADKAKILSRGGVQQSCLDAKWDHSHPSDIDRAKSSIDD
jgi:hypothetical protein